MTTSEKTNDEGLHTPGPWAWFGNAGSNSVYLATTHSGRRFVMDFVRWGFRGAQPRFQTERGVMIDAKDILQFEVGDAEIVGIDAARKDSSVYRLDVRGIKSADARLIAAAPEMMEALRKLANEVGGLRAFESELRAELGNTNWAVLMLRLSEADAAIAKAEGRPPLSSEQNNAD